MQRPYNEKDKRGAMYVIIFLCIIGAIVIVSSKGNRKEEAFDALTSVPEDTEKKSTHLELTIKKEKVSYKESAVEAPMPDTPKFDQPADSGMFSIQVASFKKKDTAVVLAGKLRELGYKAYVSSSDLASKGLWHRVRIGHFNNKDKASQTLKAVKMSYKDSYIVREGG